jgi:hypothetical protein
MELSTLKGALKSKTVWWNIFLALRVVTTQALAEKK